MQGLEKGWVANEKVAAQAGLFIHDQLDQAIGVKGDDVGAVHKVSAVLQALQTVSEDES